MARKWHSRLVRTPLAIPRPLEDWIRQQAEAAGMNRNAWLNLQLQQLKESQVLERLARLESRVAALASGIPHAPSRSAADAAPTPP